nr:MULTISPECIES: transporter associated domain-containing protein [Virgibacillus]
MFLKEVNGLLDIELSDEEIDTIGGWIFMKNLDVSTGTAIDYSGYEFIVE